ncbi:putative 4-hydroxybenzoate polyprenyltransferase [Aeoliella sp. ICT_H6.2]|uniref:4-hydroxybenzoate polyprenyltransferase n=1 Tax=Aeoliella straminimaris TaxID=2954799 RepID=A0A9X2FBU4_9BACT|nr:UbiA-like polyprenyltransferase [Aeoliella straminimaris]MCO6045654.1 putative 4-hydroxybenzoate polyprenyltransferase [Aeoliella straminimaris]
MLKTVNHLLALIRFSHTLFALPFALMSAVMAWWLRGVLSFVDPVLYHDSYIMFGSVRIPVPSGLGNVMFHFPQPEGYSSPTVADRLSAFADAIRWQEVLGILLCMVFARSAAMAFNRLVDRKIDAGNPRTAGRHIPAGILSVTQVTTFTIVCATGFVASTLLFLPNKLPLYLSVPVLLFLCGYSLTKRFTSLAHFWLGASLAMSPIAAWIAIRGEAVMQSPLDLLPAVVLGGAVLAWVSGFDILYACQDFEFDRQAKLHSVPVRLGVPGALRLAAGCHAATVVLLAILPVVYPPLGALYYVGVAAVAGLLVYEHWLVRPDDLDRVNLAFFHVNAVISIGLLVVTCLDLLVV